MKTEELECFGHDVQQYVIGLRRDLHRHPEVSMQEYRTLGVIIRELKDMGIPFVEIPNGGILAYIHGAEPGKTVLLRADCDALPQQESPENSGGKQKPTVSKCDGAAHTCGHDGHTAMLLGACRILSKRANHFSGTIVAMFERGEENCEGYYYLHKYLQENAMVFDSVFALHVTPELPTGTIGICPDQFSGGNIQFEYTLVGRSGYASRPDQAVNPIECFVAIANDLKSLRLNNMNPFHTVTYTIASVTAGNNRNIIPDELTFKGTSRFLDVEAGLVFKRKMQEIVEKNCALYQCTAKDIMLKGPLLPGVCFPPSAELARKAISDNRRTKVVTKAPFLGSESFAITLAYYPGCMVWLGIANEAEGITATLHNAHFDLDEQALIHGVNAYVAYALAFLESGFDASGFQPNELPIEVLQTQFMCRPIPPDYDKNKKRSECLETGKNTGKEI